MKQIYELRGKGQSIRGIARMLGISRNVVRKYVRDPGVPKAKPRPRRPSKLDPFKEHVHRRVSMGVDNCVILVRELREMGYDGSYTVLKEFVHPLRRPPVPAATVRFETEPGEQAQVDWGSFTYLTPEGRRRSVWAFVLVLSWSRALYVEFVPRADVATFIRCHVNAFEALGGVPRHGLYDNAKVVVLGRESDGRPQWNQRFLDFALRVGFDIRLCRPYRARTKGRVERGVQYLRRNFWPTAEFTDLDDLNRRAQAWCAGVANARVHGTTRERPIDRLGQERLHLLSLPDRGRLMPFLREERLVGRDGFVRWQGSSYGVPWRWAGRSIEVQPNETTVELWIGNERVAVHPRAQRPGERLALPGQWEGLDLGDGRPKPEPLARQLPSVEVERRPLASYDALLGVGGGR